MNTDLLNAAAIKMLEQGGLQMNDTVCVVQARSGRVYTGISRMSQHAEIEAIRNMQAAGEVIIDGMILLSVGTRLPLLPCNNCIGYILSLHPDNAGCYVILQDRIIRLGETAMYTAGSAPTAGLMPNGTVAVNTENATSDILKSRVNSIIGGLEDYDDDEEEEKKPRKGLFGFFRK